MKKMLSGVLAIALFLSAGGAFPLGKAIGTPSGSGLDFRQVRGMVLEIS